MVDVRMRMRDVKSKIQLLDTLPIGGTSLERETQSTMVLLDELAMEKLSDQLKLDLQSLKVRFDGFLTKRGDVTEDDWVRGFLASPMGRLGLEDFKRRRVGRLVTLTRAGKDRLRPDKTLHIAEELDENMVQQRKELNRDVDTILKRGSDKYQDLERFNQVVDQINLIGGVSMKKCVRMNKVYRSEAARTVAVKGQALVNARVVEGGEGQGRVEELLCGFPGCSCYFHSRGQRRGHWGRVHRYKVELGTPGPCGEA